MNQIQMVDLKSQYLKIKNEIDNEIEAVINSTRFIKGPIVDKFADNLAKYLKVKHIIPCGNGTDALQIAMMALGLKPGDEVITADFSFIATVEVIALLGLKPVLIDVDPNTFTLDIEQVKNAINSKTKAIVPIHLFGQTAPMKEIMEIAKTNNLFVIEDTAQALGAEYTWNDKKLKAGTIGDIGCTSFFPSKNLGCFGDGGAIFTNHDDYAKRMSAIVNHGMKKRYYHDYIGVNSRLDSIQAAILNVKLKYLDQYNLARLKVANYYDRALSTEKALQIPNRASYSTHIFHQYTLKTKGIDRNLLKEKLNKKNIPAMIYYPIPLHRQNAYNKYKFIDKNFPITNEFSEKVISLPMHTELSSQQQDFIINNLLKIINKL